MRQAMFVAVTWLAVALGVLTTTAHASDCTSAAFRHSILAFPLAILPGAEVVDVEAMELHGHKSIATYKPRYRDATIDEACQVRLTYVNPGTNSTRVTVTVWLPSPERWNGRFLGTGGGGWQCTMGAQALHIGFQHNAATALTDGGLRGEPFRTDYTLLSPGNPDTYLLERLGHRAIHDMTVVAKHVVEVYYGRPSRTNYYIGCSTGGRQGMMEAARYPRDYDGLLLGAPAYTFGELSVGLLAGTATMNMYDTFPTACEVNAIRRAALEACDPLDGRMDGIVARQDLCKFTAQKAIGRTYIDTCSGGSSRSNSGSSADAVNRTRTVTAEAARVYQVAVNGAVDSHGRRLAAGYPWGTDMAFSPVGTMQIVRDADTGRTHAVPFPFSRQFVEDYLKNGLESVDFSSVTFDDLTRWQAESSARYDAIMEPPNDMSAFRDRGGKIILYHGEEDMIIPVGVSYVKLDRIRAAMYSAKPYAQAYAAMHEFLRFFVVPGMSHCGVLPDRFGKAPQVDARAMLQLIAWVEHGTAPDRMQADGVPPDSGMGDICLWPSQPRWMDDGKRLTCVERHTFWDTVERLRSVLEWPVAFMERLPHILFLRTSKLTGEL